MKATIKQTLQKLNEHFGASIFSDPRRFKNALADVPIEVDAKKVRHLLNIAIGDMKAYSRLESALTADNPFIIDNLVNEMVSSYWPENATAQVVIESIAELLGYVVPVATTQQSPFVLPSTPPTPPSSSLSVGGSGDYFIDPRDGQRYRTVKIGNLVWMAENLNYKIDGSACYNNDESYGQKYGRLYTWDAAIKACPPGWHLPSDDEWEELVQLAGGKEIAGKKLKSTSGWDDFIEISGNGTDEFGFSALPGSNGYADGVFYLAGFDGYWWSATEYDANYAWVRFMDYYCSGAFRDYHFKTCLLSLRCARDL